MADQYRESIPFLFALDQGGCVLKKSATPTSTPSELTANISLPNQATYFVEWMMAGIEPTTLRLVGERSTN